VHVPLYPPPVLFHKSYSFLWKIPWLLSYGEQWGNIVRHCDFSISLDLWYQKCLVQNNSVLYSPFLIVTLWIFPQDFLLFCMYFLLFYRLCVGNLLFSLYFILSQLELTFGSKIRKMSVDFWASSKHGLGAFSEIKKYNNMRMYVGPCLGNFSGIVPREHFIIQSDPTKKS
jgi:hypothetical protein